MTVNLALKYSSKVDERFKLSSLTDSIINFDYDWTGVDTVKVYSIETSELSDYVKSGSQRYGTPDELSDSVQSLTLTQDKAFTFTIDKAYELGQEGVKSAGAALRRQLDEVVIPEIDIYRISKLIEGAKQQKQPLQQNQTLMNNFYLQWKLYQTIKCPL